MTSEQEHNDWGSPITFDIGHHYACPCCDGTGPAEYALAIHPSHLKGKIGPVPVLRLYEEELESLVNIITAPFMNRRRIFTDYSNSKCNIGDQEEAVWFNLTRNKNRHELGEYSLRVVGRGVDDILPVDGEGLENLVKTVTRMKKDKEARLEILAEKADREWNLSSLMKGKTLEQIKDQVRRVNPFVLEEEPDPQIATVLIAAAFFVGPNIERLATFASYPRNFIADISCRMHDSGLWVEGEVFFEHWFDDDLEWGEFGLIRDCLVAEGLQVARRAGEHESWRYEPSGRLWLHRAT